MSEIKLTPIGKAITPYTEQAGTPIQAHKGERLTAEIHLDQEFREGLTDLDGFDRVWILSFLHRSSDYLMKVIPYRDTVRRGLFSTRAPRRPNPIGMSLVKLLSVDIEKGIIKVDGIDLLNGTPILDIKPYVVNFECFPESRCGWLDKANNRQTADDRFADWASDD